MVDNLGKKDSEEWKTFPFSERKGPRTQQPGNYIILSASVEVDRYTLAARIPRRIITDSLRFCLWWLRPGRIRQSISTQVRETLLSLRGRRQSVDYPTRNGMGSGARLTDVFRYFVFFFFFFRMEGVKTGQRNIPGKELTPRFLQGTKGKSILPPCVRVIHFALITVKLFAWIVRRCLEMRNGESSNTFAAYI